MNIQYSNKIPRHDDIYQVCGDEKAKYVIVEADAYDAFCTKYHALVEESDKLAKASVVDDAWKTANASADAIRAKVAEAQEHLAKVESARDHYASLRKVLLAHNAELSKKKEECT